MATLEEKLDKIRSPNLQSQTQTKVILNAVEETLKEQNAQSTPTGYFAALLALLNQSLGSGQANNELTPSIVYLLDVVTPYAPQPLLRSKFTQVFTLLAPVLLLEDAEAPLLRSSIGCLESLLLAQDSGAWKLPTNEISPRRAVAGLLNLAVDHRPKVRKRGQDALRKVLKNPPPSPSLDHPAADLCAETAMRSLTNVANEAALSKKQKKSSTEHDPALIHSLQLVKTVTVASSGWPSKNIEALCELLLSIAKSGNGHMTMAVFDIFEMIFESMAADEVASAKLPRLLEIISEMRPSANDTQLLPPWIAILSRGYDVSAQVEPEDTFQKLPDLFTMVSEFMESSSHNIRISASECLISFMANCIPDQVIIEPSIYDEKTLEKIAKSAENLLSVKYQAAWMETFSVLGAIFDALRWRADPMMLNVARTVGELRGSDSFTGKKEADEVLGKAVQAMGPESVLSVLPLNLVKPVKDQPGRAWMLPILRDHTTSTNLQHFKTEFIPLSEAMFQRVLDNGEAAKTMEIKIYETLVRQTWSILPGYCDLPLDLTVAFDQTFAEMLANLLYTQVDLRLDVCRALKALVESNKDIITMATAIDTADNLILRGRVSEEDAQKNLTYLGNFAGNLLAVLFNVYSQTLPQTRGPILQTINAYLSITPEKELVETFDRVSAMLASSLNEGSKEKGQKAKEQMPSTSQTLMDLVITMSIYLPRQSFGPLFNIAALIIVRNEDPQLQKKAYKLIPRLAESELGVVALRERITEIQDLLLSSAEKVSVPARRERLAAITALVPFIPDSSLHFVPSVLSEVVICCKENNERARTLAFELLVLMGKKLAEAKGKPIDNSKVPNMPKDAPPVSASIEEYFTMVSAGLAGSTPHMISASITALTRILYEFRDTVSKDMLSDIVQTMDLFLTSNNREIVKSVLGFVKVCVISLPMEMMLPRLPTMIPNLMVWAHEHKGHFRGKVKHILERMVRRFGFDVVNRNCPEADRKVITNIRKTKERSKRRKEAAKEGDEEDDDQQNGKRRARFESEYDEALYSSGESDASDDSDVEILGKSRKAQKGGSTYIIEDEDEPLDLLDRKALASISSTKPGKLRKAGRTKAKTDLDGKLILGEDDDGDDAMVIDTPGQGGEEGGVGAYVAALKSKDVGRRGRGGRLKFSNKRGKDDDDEEMDVDEKEVSIIKTQVNRGGRGGRGGRGDRGGFSSRGGPRTRGGGMRGGRSGRGGIASGRRGLGQEKRHGPAFAGKVGKPKSPGRR